MRAATPLDVTGAFEKIVQEVHYHSRGIFNQYTKIVITRDKLTNEAAKLHKDDESIRLQATLMAGDGLMTWVFDRSCDQLDGCLESPRRMHW